MAFLANKNIFSQLRSHQPKIEASVVPSRGYHIELGQREKDLLAKDPALKRFKSHKNGVRTIKRIGDVLTIVVVASTAVAMKSMSEQSYGKKLVKQPTPAKLHN